MIPKSLTDVGLFVNFSKYDLPRDLKKLLNLPMRALDATGSEVRIGAPVKSLVNKNILPIQSF